MIVYRTANCVVVTITTPNTHFFTEPSPSPVVFSPVVTISSRFGHTPQCFCLHVSYAAPFALCLPFQFLTHAGNANALPQSTQTAVKYKRYIHRRRSLSLSLLLPLMLPDGHGIKAHRHISDANDDAPVADNDNDDCTFGISNLHQYLMSNAPNHNAIGAVEPQGDHILIVLRAQSFRTFCVNWNQNEQHNPFASLTCHNRQQLIAY